MALYKGTQKVCPVIKVQPTLTTKNITQNGTYNASSDNADGYSSVTVNVQGGSIPLDLQSSVDKYNYIIRKGNDNISFEQVQLTDDFQTYYGMSGDDTEIDTHISDSYWNNSDIVNLCLGAVTTVSGNDAFHNPNRSIGAFQDCYNLTNVDLSSLTTVSGDNAFEYTFGWCNNLTSVDLSSLTTVSGSYAMKGAFASCGNLTHLNLDNLTTLSGDYCMESFCRGNNLTTFSFSSLTSIQAYSIFREAFADSQFLQDLYFPALTSTSVDFEMGQFDDMLFNTSNVTVHFPSNLQSTMFSQWMSVVSGFGGGNTTVLFDLPATT